MTGPDPMEYGWWLASRAAGVVALLCIAVSVGVGLAMASRLAPRSARGLLSIHQQTALAGLVAIAVHGITLLGDRFLSPSLGDIAIPFTSEHEPLWTGLGVTGGWLAAVLGLSYWIRNRMGAGLWRRLHKATILVYVLSVAHTLGAGTDASEPWMLALLAATAAPIVFLFLLRVLTPAPPPAFRPFRVADIRPESSSVLSFELVPADGRPAPPHEPGQFVPVRVGDEVRSYSLSSASRRRISVKREGRVSTHLHTAVEVGDVLDVGAPSGTFVVGPPSDVPLVLISAGIGVTPLLAMLESQAGSERAIWWVHSARDAAEHAFRGEAKAHLARIAHGHSHVRYTREEGRLTGAQILALGVPVDAEFRLCGPTRFVADMTADLAAAGAERIESESFGGAPAPGPVVKFSRSGVTATYDARHTSLLEVAEANAVPVASGCRIGACHGCRAGVVTGTVRHQPEPLQPPPPGSALLCCAVPEGDVVLDA
jgi:ferredoxin-NADP reductase